MPPLAIWAGGEVESLVQREATQSRADHGGDRAVVQPGAPAPERIVTESTSRCGGGSCRADGPQGMSLISARSHVLSPSGWIAPAAGA